MIVIGEVFSNLPKDNEEAHENLNKLVKELNADISPTNQGAIILAKKILINDSRITPTDAVIVAQALSDENSTYLFTFDSTLATSMQLEEWGKKGTDIPSGSKRNSKLRIQATFS